MGYLRLSDDFVQVSSIMPQKRNPVALEHARALASKAMAQCHSIAVAVHNTPFGDIVDTEDDLQPLVASAFKDTTRAIALVAAAMAGAEFDREDAPLTAGSRSRTRRHARTRSRLVVQGRTFDRGRARARASRSRGRAALRRWSRRRRATSSDARFG